MFSSLSSFVTRVAAFIREQTKKLVSRESFDWFKSPVNNGFSVFFASKTKSIPKKVKFKSMLGFLNMILDGVSR